MLETLSVPLFFFFALLYATSRGNELRQSVGSMNRVHLVLEEGKRQQALEREAVRVNYDKYLSERNEVKIVSGCP